MTRYAYEPHDHEYANFRHFFDRNALSLWGMGIAVLACVLALPAFI